jgi:hypothetical protein
MADVFISYKREERAEVQRIVEHLQGLKLSVWFDSRLPSGRSFDEEINHEVRSAKCVLVCWSRGAVESEWVRAEAAIGRERNVLCAIILEPTQLYPPFNLIHADDLSDWDGRDLHPGWLALQARIGELTQRPDLVERGARYLPSSDVGTKMRLSNPVADRGRGTVILIMLVVATAIGGYAAWMKYGPLSCSTVEQAAPPRDSEQWFEFQVRFARENYFINADTRCKAHFSAQLAGLETQSWNHILGQEAAGEDAAALLAAYEWHLTLFPQGSDPPPRHAEQAAARASALREATDSTPSEFRR